MAEAAKPQEMVVPVRPPVPAGSPQILAGPHVAADGAKAPDMAVPFRPPPVPQPVAPGAASGNQRDLPIPYRPPVPGTEPVGRIDNPSYTVPAGPGPGGPTAADSWSDAAPVVQGAARGTKFFSPAAPRTGAPADRDEPRRVVASPAPAPTDDEEEEPRRGLWAWLLGLLDDLPCWLASMVFHLVLFLLFSMWVRPGVEKELAQQLLVTPPEQEELELRDDLAEHEVVQAVELKSPLGPPDKTVADVPAVAAADPAPVAAVQNLRDSQLLTPAADLQAAALRLDLPEVGLDRSVATDLTAAFSTPTGNALAGRDSGVRGEFLGAAGGSPGSERAVAAALRWLAEHQLPDGGWNFNLNEAPNCKGQCRKSGQMGEARNAATAMALLPFLGAGQTHQNRPIHGDGPARAGLPPGAT